MWTSIEGVLLCLCDLKTPLSVYPIGSLEAVLVAVEAALTAWDQGPAVVVAEAMCRLVTERGRCKIWSGSSKSKDWYDADCGGDPKTVGDG